MATCIRIMTSANTAATATAMIHSMPELVRSTMTMPPTASTGA